MRLRRGPLFWGLFLIPLGAIPLLVRANVLDATVLADAWRFWPLILVALGAALILGRGVAGALGTAAAALVLGIAAGGALASGGAWIGNFADCSPGGTLEQTGGSGTFEGTATVDLDFRCGELELSTGPGSDWQVDAAYRGAAPRIEGTASRLEVSVPNEPGTGRQEWTISVPAANLGEIRLRANAGTGSLDLAGANLNRVDAEFNAGDLLITAGEASVGRIHVGMNAGRARITLGSGGTTGDLSVNAGAIDLCVPADAALRLTVNEQLTFAHNLDDRGLAKSGTTWTRSGSGAEIALDVQGNAASFTLDPDGGCR
jgi:hypothetical protein